MSNDLVKFNTILGDMADTFERKNSDYGNSFKESLDEDGLIAAKVRMMDKMRRFSNLISSEAQVKDESIIDTLKDLANYAVMTAMYIENMSETLSPGCIVEVTESVLPDDVGVVGRLVFVYNSPVGYDIVTLHSMKMIYAKGVRKLTDNELDNYREGGYSECQK